VQQCLTSTHSVHKDSKGIVVLVKFCWSLDLYCYLSSSSTTLSLLNETASPEPLSKFRSLFMLSYFVRICIMMRKQLYPAKSISMVLCKLYLCPKFPSACLSQPLPYPMSKAQMYAILFIFILPFNDRLCSLVARVPACRPRGPEINSWRYHIF
jgi:hypothetical protein